MSVRLRELIRMVRDCKTAEEERKVVTTECAAIRTALKEQNQYRAKNVAKLIYIHMLGYPTQFGQMECVTLITSSKYPEKRIGYLALMILLDENQEVLPLTEHTLKKDLDDKNQFVQALALTTIANIGSVDICRDLSSEVEKLLITAPSYIRKKAALAAVRIISKCPELIDNYIEKMDTLLSNEQQQRNHAVLITSLCLIIEIVRAKTDDQPTQTQDLNNEDDKKKYVTKRKYVLHFRKYIPILLKLLRGLIMSPYALEHDVGGVSDPFLQVKILRLLRVLGKGSTKASEAMNDVLVQVATNTDSPKNAGNAVLYECVKIIMDIESEKGLRVLGINQLSKFLGSRDHNLRYVALQMLAKVAHKDFHDVNRHQKTIIECLKDADLSIRKRALDLIIVLVNQDNCKSLVGELMTYLQSSSNEDSFKEQLTTKMCTLIETYAPDKEWKIDTLLKLIITSGQYVREEIATVFIGLITQSKELQSRITKKLFHTLKKISSNQSVILKQGVLLQVGVWCIGEYADLALDGSEPDEEPISQEQIVDLLFELMSNIPRESINGKHSTTSSDDSDSSNSKWSTSHDISRAFLLMALVKLCSHISDSNSVERIKTFLDQNRNVMELEFQQRCCEYYVLLNDLEEEKRRKILDRMPPIEIQHIVNSLANSGNNSNQPSSSVKSPKSPTTTLPIQKPKTSLEQLISIDEEDQPVITAPSGNNSMSILESFFDSDVTDVLPSNPISLPVNNKSSGNTFGEMSLLDGLLSPALGPVVMPVSTPPVSFSAPNQNGPRKVPLLNKNGITIRMDCKVLDAVNNPQLLNAIIYFSNSNSYEISNIDFMMSVPKNYINLQMFKSSDSKVPANSDGKVTQKLKLTNLQHGVKPISFKFKFQYKDESSQQIVVEEGKIVL